VEEELGQEQQQAQLQGQQRVEWQEFSQEKLEWKWRQGRTER
jgi:hypothetical protein